MRYDSDESFDDFAAAVMPRLRHLAYAWCHDWHHSDDVVQDSMERLYASWARVRRERQEYPYVRTILIRRLISENRRAWRRHETSTLDTTDDKTIHPERRSGRDEEAEATVERLDALGLLGQLPPRQRAVAILRFMENLPVAEVADLLQCSEGTVKSQAHHARRHLQQHLASPQTGLGHHPTSPQPPARSGETALDVPSPDGARP